VKTQLKEFQVLKVAELFRAVRMSRNELREGGDRQVLVLSSATGSGKTLMTTALMEQVLEGDGTHPGDTAAVFLWLTDDPELNEQSRRRILQTSSVFGPEDVVTVDAAFDATRFSPGKVYLLNTQKLGKDTSYVRSGDGRTHTLWDSIANTVQASPASFLVIIDEAHKGMGHSKSDVAVARTIVQRFIKGSHEIPAIPLMLGISATPERFRSLIADVPRLLPRPVTVPISDVRESGLIKDKVVLYHPTAKAATDWSLLHEAATTWLMMRDAWAAYGARERLAEPVRPVLVVQVEDGTAQQDTRTNLEQVLQVIESVMGPLADDHVAHAFQDGHSLHVGERTIRHIAPADIQDDQALQAVLFKMSLNTGWDCPRAEVMMSFRRATDYTSIAQLVGRMVRTPLAREVEQNELLNTVALYLPNYDKAAVTQVIGRLSDPNDDGIGSDVNDGDGFILSLGRTVGSDHFAALLERVPSYRVSRLPKQPNIKRLAALGRYLEQDNLRLNAIAESLAHVTRVLVEQLARAKQDPSFTARLAGSEKVDLRTVTFQFGSPDTSEGSGVATLHEANLESLFEWTGKRLGNEGLHLAYIKERVARSHVSVGDAKRELFVLLNHPGVWDALEASCRQQVTEWLAKYQPAINDKNKISEEQRARYNRVRRMAAKPDPSTLHLPEAITGNAAGRLWPKHLFVDDKALYPCVVTSWEEGVLQDELGRDEVKLWLRNPPNKEWSFSIDYVDEQGDRTNMYPDFLIVRDEGEGPIVDILEPHRADEGDAPRKIIGLAGYAEQHGDLFGRIQVIAKIDGAFRRIDINDEASRQAAKNIATTTQGVMQLFKDYGY